MSDSGGFGPLTADEREVIGPYRIAGRMGAGGMGVVYAGIAPDGARVAVKVIHPGLAADPDFHARFVREVDMLSRVRGRCTVSVLAADTAAMPPWLATEYVPGPTLNAFVRGDGPLAYERLTDLGVDIAEALTDIHRAGVVHRDLKPGNVILSASGAKVLDFGIARALDESGLTGTGGLIGTPGWISPEQYRGEQADAAADVFAWGALMTYAATGQPPFGTGPPEVLAYRVMSADPDVSGVSAPLRALVRAALAKDRAARPAAHEVLARMAAIRAGAADPAGGGKRVTVPLWPVAAAATAVVVAGVVIAVSSSGVLGALVSPGRSSSSADAAEQTSESSGEAPSDTPSDTPERTPDDTPEPTPEPTPEKSQKKRAAKTPEESETPSPSRARRPSIPCATSSAVLSYLKRLNQGSLPDDARVTGKRCSGRWVAARIDSPSVGGVKLIATQDAGGFTGGEYGSNVCSVTDQPSLLRSAPATIRDWLCPNGFS